MWRSGAGIPARKTRSYRDGESEEIESLHVDARFSIGSRMTGGFSGGKNPEAAPTQTHAKKKNR